jgi:hypothetical protein
MAMQHQHQRVYHVSQAIAGVVNSSNVTLSTAGRLNTPPHVRLPSVDECDKPMIVSSTPISMTRVHSLVMSGSLVT